MLSLPSRTGGFRPPAQRGERKVRKMLFAAAGAALLATPLHARETAWMGVGTRTVTAEAVSQTIEVRGVNVPRETMFCSDGAAVQIVRRFGMLGFHKEVFEIPI